MCLGAPCVDSGASIAFPGIVVASVINDHILVGLGCQDVPVVSVIQVLVPIVAQICRADV